MSMRETVIADFWVVQYFLQFFATFSFCYGITLITLCATRQDFYRKLMTLYSDNQWGEDYICSW